MENEIAKQIVDIFAKDKNSFNNLLWCAFYNKYNEEHLCFKDKNWNISVSNLVSEELTEDRAGNAEKLKPFYQWLGERVALSLNLQAGKSNEELKNEYEQHQKQGILN